MEAIVRQGMSPQREVLRARIALMADRGDATQAIAEALQVAQQTVTKWRRQAALRGQDGLQEAAHSGRPRRISDAARLQLVALACGVPEPEGRSTPTLDEIRAKAMVQMQAIERKHVDRPPCPGRFPFHVTPIHASWVNQIELLFGIFAK